MNVFPLQRELFCDVGSTQAPVFELQGIVRQDGTANGHGFAVHHIDTAGKILGGDDSALVGAGEQGGDRDDYHILSIFNGFFISLGKVEGRGLTGGRQHFAACQLFIEDFVIDIYTVNKVLLAKMNGQWNNANTLFHFGSNVGGGIDNDTNGIHKLNPSWEIFLMLREICSRLS